MTRQVLCVGSGALMVATAAVQVSGWAAICGVLAAAVAVPVGLLARPAATAAVVLTVPVIGLCPPPPALAAASGLAALGYLMTRHAGAIALTVPTLAAATLFTGVGLVAATFPVALPWLPLLAPPAVFGGYLLAVRPFPGAPGNDRTSPI